MMTGLDLGPLSDTPPDRSLDGLEATVWSRVAARETAEKRLARLATMQFAVLVASVMGSAAIGGLATTAAAAKTPELGVFSPHAVLAPSSRLMGGR